MNNQELQNNDISSVSDLTPQHSKAKQSMQQTMSKKEAEIRANFHADKEEEKKKDSGPTM